MVAGFLSGAQGQWISDHERLETEPGQVWNKGKSVSGDTELWKATPEPPHRSMLSFDEETIQGKHYYPKHQFQAGGLDAGSWSLYFALSAAAAVCTWAPLGYLSCPVLQIRIGSLSSLRVPRGTGREVRVLLSNQIKQ